MTYTLTKNKTRIKIRFLPENAELTRAIDGRLSTQVNVMTHAVASREVNRLLRDGWKAVKSK